MPLVTKAPEIATTENLCTAEMENITFSAQIYRAKTQLNVQHELLESVWSVLFPIFHHDTICDSKAT